MLLSMSKWGQCALLVLVGFTGACHGGGSEIMRSGSMKDDNVEEPIPSSAKKYEPLLLLANEMTTMLENGQVRELHAAYADKSLNEREIEKLYSELVGKVGKAISFKPRQWYFRVFRGTSQSYVASQKIVTHERATLYYTFTFSDEHARRIIGLHFRARPTSAPYPP